jgi:hypothetical protein
MDTTTLVIIEGILIFGLVLAFAVRELLVLRREKRKDEQLRQLRERETSAK